MIQLLCEELAQLVRSAELAPVVGGLALAWKYNDKSKHTKAVYWDYQQGEHVNLVPDAEHASILYFEERGNTQILSQQPFQYKADLVLIGWVNTTKGANTLRLITELQRLLKGQHTTENFRLNLTFSELLPESESLFSRYQYDSAVKKYLHKPYDAFGLRLSAQFSVCLP